MTGYIAPEKQITPIWLTAVLRQAGILANGEVTSIESQETGAFNSETSHLLLHYSADAFPNAPTRLVLKRNSNGDGEYEVRFYNLIPSLTDHPSIIIPCYAAAYDARSGNSYVLLHDLSETHAPPVTRDQQISIVDGIPSPQAIEQVVEALAQLHAYWWDHPLFEQGIFEVGYWSRNAERFEQYFQRRLTAWQYLVRSESDWFPADVRELYEKVFARLPSHWQHYVEPRFRTRTHLTLTHNDTYFANFLSPKDNTTERTYLLDWQSPGVEIGGYDLANLCATFWNSQQRQQDQREMQVLRRYYAVLQAHGVTTYSWDELLADYKTGLIFWLLMPVQDCFDGSKRSYWWPKMQCLVAAFREWNCSDLLETDDVSSFHSS